MTQQQYIAERLAQKLNEHFFGLSQEDINQKLASKQVERIDKTLLSRLKTATYTSLGPTTKAFKALAQYFEIEPPVFWEQLGKGFQVAIETAPTEQGISLALPSFTVWSTILVNPLINSWPDYLRLCVHKNSTDKGVLFYNKDNAHELWAFNQHQVISAQLWDEGRSPFASYQFSGELMELLFAESNACNAVVIPQLAIDSYREEDNGVLVLPNGQEIVPVAEIAEGYGALLCLLWLKDGNLIAEDEERGYSIDHYNLSEMLTHNQATQVTLERIRNGYSIEEALVYANLDTFRQELESFERHDLVIRHMKNSTASLQWETVVEHEIKVRFPELFAKLSRVYDRSKIDLTSLEDIEEKLAKVLNEGKAVIYTSPAPFVHNLCQVARFKVEAGKHIHIIRWNLSQWLKQKQSFVLYMRRNSLTTQTIQQVIHFLSQVENSRKRINADMLHKYSFFTNIKTEANLLLKNDIEPIELFEKAIQELQFTDTPITYTAQFVKFLSAVSQK
ncbi:MAG: hypothetical protein U0Y10_09700 [Spirosomataceae bacterium]